MVRAGAQRVGGYQLMIDRSAHPADRFTLFYERGGMAGLGLSLYQYVGMELNLQEISTDEAERVHWAFIPSG